MNDLLQVAVNAHGGLARWSQWKPAKASLSIMGAIWQVKGRPDVTADWPNAAGASGGIEGADEG